jgi:hypothetical protein
MSSRTFHMSRVESQFVSVNEDRNTAIITGDLRNWLGAQPLSPGCVAQSIPKVASHRRGA